MSIAFPFIIIVWIFLFFVIFTNMLKNLKGKPKVRSSDGHRVPRNEDLTCETNDGHNHVRYSEEEYGKRYIVHNEPETGYVVLNGVKRRLEDCKYL